MNSLFNYDKIENLFRFSDKNLEHKINKDIYKKVVEDCVGIKSSREHRKECEAKGGYVLMERGVFQDCLLGVKSIK